MIIARRILRDPLIHFLLLGGLLFVLHAVIGNPDRREDDEKTIVVDREALLTFMQYRASAFEPEYFEAQFDALAPEQLHQLAQAYVQEEAMSREAQALGLNHGDYVIRQRLVQKIEFLIGDVGSRVKQPADQEMRRYFAAHRDKYHVEPTYTFSHVFVDNEKQHPKGGLETALDLQARLEADGAAFNDAPSYGDRFPYLQNYVGRDLRFISDQFGNDFARQLNRLQPSDEWQGPVRSQFGYHLIMLAKRDAASAPEFEQVRAQVAEDMIGESEAALRTDLIDDLVDQYRVEYRGLAVPGTPGGNSGR